MNEKIKTLFEELEEAFNKSCIKKYAEEKGYSWNYAITSTKINENAILIAGLNWGADDHNSHDAQTELPTKSFEEVKKENGLGSLSRIYKPLKEYLNESEFNNIIQSNFCFFRSNDSSEISKYDFILSTPLFGKFLSIISPKIIFGFTDELKTYLNDNDLYNEKHTRSIKSNKTTVKVSSGFYQLDGTKIPICFLPHPNRPISSDARKKSWEFCFHIITHDFQLAVT